MASQFVRPLNGGTHLRSTLRYINKKTQSHKAGLGFEWVQLEHYSTMNRSLMKFESLYNWMR